ncbi:polysaccharide lyase [Spirochaeta dissipatitropha]
MQQRKWIRNTGNISAEKNNTVRWKKYNSHSDITVKIIIVLLSFVFLSCNTNRVTPYDYGKPVYINLDFEDGTHSPWEGQYNDSAYNGQYNFEISTKTPPNGGNFSGRFFLGSGGDYWLSPNNGLESARSEIQLKSTAQEGNEIYYSWFFMIDSNYIESDDWQIIGQFHDQPDPAIGETWNNYPANNPALSYKYRNGQLIIAVYSFESKSVMDLVGIPINKGEWYQIKSRIFWSTEDDGFMEFWLDGQQIEASGLTRYTARNCFNKAGNYLKLGIYRSKDIDSVGIVYFDNILSGPTAQSAKH